MNIRLPSFKKYVFAILEEMRLARLSDVFFETITKLIYALMLRRGRYYA